MREQRPLELLPQRAPDETPMPAVPASPEPPVDAWLARQIAREQESPVITLDLLDPPPAKLEVPTPVPHLDLEPPPTTEAVASAPVPPAASHLEDASVEPAAHISPVAPTASVPVPVYGLREESAPLSPPSINPFLAEDFFTPEKAFTPPEPRPGLAALQALEANESKSSGGSSWMLGIEPLPSWEENAPGETAADETPELAANFMQAAPPPSEVVESPAPVSAPPPQQPVFLPSLFQGAALPDEICVPAPQEAVETPLVAASA
ncbi:MAG: hypothetical protein JNG86_21080, partial [Verrucomicrobiaceae bacterium]|nr:hypothetical protein [Verrucomicrobiaceae bacterium]